MFVLVYGRVNVNVFVCELYVFLYVRMYICLFVGMCLFEGGYMFKSLFGVCICECDYV